MKKQMIRYRIDLVDIDDCKEYLKEAIKFDIKQKLNLIKSAGVCYPALFLCL